MMIDLVGVFKAWIASPDNRFYPILFAFLLVSLVFVLVRKSK